MHTLYWNTASPLLRAVLEELMVSKLFKPFRLVGGTALALQLGHRVSVDIDLFTDATYGSLDFVELDHFLRKQYPYVSMPVLGVVAMGRQYFVGQNENEVVKLDNYPLEKMLRLHEERYPYDHNEALILNKFTNFTGADEDFEPICLRGKHWEIVKLDIIDVMK